MKKIAGKTAIPIRAKPPGRMRENTKDSEVYDFLRARIMRNELRPGERLREEQLCRELGVTRTPLRLALRRLEHERLVVGEPFRGVHVREVQSDEIAPLFDMREVLEGLAARNVALAGDAEVLASLQALAEQCDALGQSEKWPQFFAADKAFHGELVQRARNDKLREVMEVYNFQLRTFSFHDRYLLYVVAQLQSDGFATHLAAQHQELVQFLKAGDSTGAEEAFRTHVRGSKQLVLNACERWQSEQSPA